MSAEMRSHHLAEVVPRCACSLPPASTGCFSLIIPERLRGNDLFWDHFEAVRSFDRLNLDEKYIANPFRTRGLEMGQKNRS